MTIIIKRVHVTLIHDAGSYYWCQRAQFYYYYKSTRRTKPPKMNPAIYLCINSWDPWSGPKPDFRYGWLQKSSADFRFQRYILWCKFSRRSDRVFRRYEPKCGKMQLLSMLGNSSKILDPNPDADELQNLISFALVYRYISGEISMNIRSIDFTRGC